MRDYSTTIVVFSKVMTLMILHIIYNFTLDNTVQMLILPRQNLITIILWIDWPYGVCMVTFTIQFLNTCLALCISCICCCVYYTGLSELQL